MITSRAELDGILQVIGCKRMVMAKVAICTTQGPLLMPSTPVQEARAEQGVVNHAA